MKKRTIAGLAAAAALGIGTAALASGMEWQARPMLGSNEVPANASPSEARAQFEMEDGELHYKLRMREPIKGAIAAHIHMGAPGVNGPVVVGLFAASRPGVDFGRRDTVASGVIRPSDLTGPLLKKSLSDLVALLNSGNAYVNLHTEANRGGELRAQVTVDE